MTKVVIALTSYHGEFYEGGHKTGAYLLEALHPFEYFRSQNYEVDFVSENGDFGWDENSIGPDALAGDDKAIFLDKHSEFNVTVAKIRAAAKVDAKDYDIFFAAGGHGTVFDFPKAAAVHNLALQIYARNGVVAAVCHGPAIFDGLKNATTGESLIKGKKVTGFTDEGEKLVGLEETLKRHNVPTMKDIITKAGGIYDEPKEPWGDYSIADGRLVSGVNPALARSTAVKAVEALKASA